MTTQIAHLYATLCLAIVFFQIALIWGAPWGAYTQGGYAAGKLPPGGRVIAALSIPVLVFQALAIVSVAGFPLGWPRWTGWTALAVQVVTTILNLITRSDVERKLWAPLSAVMTAMALVVMTS